MQYGFKNISKELQKKLPPFFCGEASFVCSFSVFLFVLSSFILFAFSFRFLLKTTKVAFKL
ncbi:hypothetical protein IQ65_11965 [Leptospira interrogans serovar Lai]|nr:hypothetical protein IQ65_11965 [Leptospira interrogans serovar Lai]